jgi:glutathione synthase/RimK-type ligase-like ATP-grasp enzyme
VHVAVATALDQEDLDQDDVPLVAALAAAGHRASLLAWDDPGVDWALPDVVVVRSTWNYHPQRDAYLAWADRVAAVTTLHNPADVLRWNTHKSYLLELEERGAPVVPTAWLARGDRADLVELAASRGWDEVVCKPAVGAGSDGVVRVRATEGQAALDALVAAGDAMVQPFMPTVETEGELSVIVLGGEVSHAVWKRPAAGSFLVQVEHGGVYEPLAEVPDEVASLARWVVAATGHDLLYARVDLLVDEVGSWLLTELELTEPALYLDLVDGAAERFVAALEHRTGSVVADREAS